MVNRVVRVVVPAALVCLGVLEVHPAAQDRLKSMPGYARYQEVAPQIPGALKSGAIAPTWSADGTSFEYTLDGKRYRYDLATRQATAVADAADAAGRGGRGGRGQGAPERGRQFASADSPDNAYRAQFNEKDRNLYLVDQAAKAEIAVTTDGSRERRIKYGSASWVYGEELDQITAMWWSPDSRKLAFYRFDESPVPDYYLQLDQTRLQSAIDTEAYPKAGVANPIVDLLIYDVASKKTTRIDVREGKPFTNDVVGHYAYNVRWTPDGRELLFNRTNRRQNVLELVAANPDTGALRVVIREEWPTGWIENSPAMVFLKDGRRFIWESERNGWSNFYLYDLTGKLIAPLTASTSFEAAALVKVDESAGVMFYTARDGDNHLKLQLHRVGLDGRGDVRLTDPKFHHTVGSCMPAPAGGRGRGGAAACGISPDNKLFVDVYQAHDIAPASRVVDAADGKVVAEVAASDLSRYDKLGIRKAELFTYKSADGQTPLHGLVQFPSNFDSSRKYPVLVQVYGGPASASNTARETFVVPSALDRVRVPGRQPRFEKRSRTRQAHARSGLPEAGTGRNRRHGRRRARARLALVCRSRTRRHLRHLLRRVLVGDVDSAAPRGLRGGIRVSSPVTAWQHYDSIYTERYMWIPQENKAGYDAGSAMTYVQALKGRLMLYYGTADNNVHPSNMMQLIAALQGAGKSFDVQVGPDRGHSGINTDRMMEFFLEALMPKPAVTTTSQASR